MNKELCRYQTPDSIHFLNTYKSHQALSPFHKRKQLKNALLKLMKLTRRTSFEKIKNYAIKTHLKLNGALRLKKLIERNGKRIILGVLQSHQKTQQKKYTAGKLLKNVIKRMNRSLIFFVFLRIKAFRSNLGLTSRLIGAGRLDQFIKQQSLKLKKNAFSILFLKKKQASLLLKVLKRKFLKQKVSGFLLIFRESMKNRQRIMETPTAQSREEQKMFDQVENTRNIYRRFKSYTQLKKKYQKSRSLSKKSQLSSQNSFDGKCIEVVTSRNYGNYQKQNPEQIISLHKQKIKNYVNQIKSIKKEMEHIGEQNEFYQTEMQKLITAKSKKSPSSELQRLKKQMIILEEEINHAKERVYDKKKEKLKNIQEYKEKAEKCSAAYFKIKQQM